MEATIVCVFVFAFAAAKIEECENDLPRKFDYIVVGGGTAGSVVAARLSEDKDVTVLLLEAGKKDTDQPETPLIETPALFVNLLRTGKFSWPYTTVPQKNAFLGLPNQIGSVIMGRGLGGSSTHNAMAFSRGHRFDFEFWASNGATGWSFTDVLPFFKKLENNRASEFRNSGYRGKCGPIAVSESDIQTGFTDLMFNASFELGFQKKDCNGPDPIGICKLQSHIKSGIRSSASSGYLTTVLGRKNLYVVTEAFVRKVFISRRSKMAFGVQFVRNNIRFNIRANLEVILSAGTFRSPQLLLLAGIGPRKHLHQLGVKTIANLPVGDNLHDHMSVVLPVVQNRSPPADETNPEEVAKYLFRRKGVLSTGEVLFLHFKISSTKSLPWPDVSGIFSDGADSSRITEKSFQRGTTRNAKPRPGMRIIVDSLHPTSRGTVRLKSKDPSVFPLIDPNYLSTDEDISQFIKGIRLIQSFLQTPTMKKVNSKLDIEIDECDNFTSNSNRYLKCFIQYRARSAAHPVGTCKMGSVQDKSTVVDPRLRVKGVKQLRVVDASIAPEITSGRSTALVIMIAEKAADMIKQDRKRKYRRAWS